MIDKENLNWLVHVPAGDINFKTRLQEANIETLIEALKSELLSKASRTSIERRINILSK